MFWKMNETVLIMRKGFHMEISVLPWNYLDVEIDYDL